MGSAGKLKGCESSGPKEFAFHLSKGPKVLSQLAPCQRLEAQRSRHFFSARGCSLAAASYQCYLLYCAAGPVGLLGPQSAQSER